MWAGTVWARCGLARLSSVALCELQVMRFQTHLCWYLDATFCYSFHGYQEQGIDVLLSMRLVLFGLFTFALCCVGYITAMAAFTALNFGHPLGRDSEAEARTEIGRWSNARATGAMSSNGTSSNGSASGPSGGGGGGGTEAEGGPGSMPLPRKGGRRGGRRGRAMLDYLASISPLAMIGVLFFLCFPPIFYDQIFMPCWECFDFEAAIAHEASNISPACSLSLQHQPKPATSACAALV